MIKTAVTVEGMMCQNCEKHVNEAVKKNFKVKQVSSSREDKLTVILSKKELDAEKLVAVITDAGYTAGEVTVTEE